ncbi:MAG: hypothetical protein RL648_64 [Verrucomicrobiota bacterium]
MQGKAFFSFLLGMILGSSFAGAASPDQPLVSAGLPLAGPVEGTYLFLQSEDVGPPAVYQVFRKDGDGSTSNTNPYQLVGQMRPQTDPRTINALLLRGEALFEDDLSTLESTLDSFLQAMVDDPSVADISMPEKLATLIDVAATDPEIRDNLRLLAKRFKGVGLAMGIAYAEAVTGEYTYELRQADDSDQDPYEASLVVARLTVDTTAPAPLLPAPTKLTAIPMTDPRGHAVVRLRWASPDALRERGPVHYGYQLYRNDVPVNDQPILPQEELSESEATVAAIDSAITARFNIPADWNLSSADTLRTDPSYAFPATEGDRQAARQTRIVNQNALEDLQRVYHFIDDGGLARGDGTGLNPGDSHTYTVAALDVLGRPGTLSDSLTVTVPGLEPPAAPKNVEVVNDYYYDSSSSSGSQQLKVRWPALRDEAGNIRYDLAYLVYRWNSPTEYLRYAEYPWGHGTTELDAAYAGRPLPPIGLVAAPIDLGTPMDGYMEWIDPTIDINYQSLQIHYTVRAVVDSGSELPGSSGSGFPTMSGHSAPAMGVLRDREGPGKATIHGARLPCPLISLTCFDESNTPIDRTKGPGDTSFVDVDVSLVNAAQLGTFKAARFAYRTASSGPFTQLETVGFDSNGSAKARISLPGSELPTGIYVSCQVQLANGFWSDETTCTLSIPKGSSRDRQRFLVEFLGYTYNTYDCGTVFYPYEVDGTEIDPALGVTPAADTYAYSFYRRVDNSRLELIRNVETETELDTATALILVDETPPNFFRRLCYYYQGRDQHGNPGPLQRIECLSFAGPQSEMPQPQIKQVTRTEGSTDTNPGLTVEFFCPPAGVESFLIEVRTPTGDLPLELTPYNPANRSTRALIGTVSTRNYPEAHRYAAYPTVALSLLNQDAGLFSIAFGGISPDLNYVFRVIARGPYYGDPNAPADGPVIEAVEGLPSAEATGNWRALVPPVDTAIPTVRWPARANIAPIDLFGNPSLNPTGPIAVEFVDVQYNTSHPHTVGWRGVGIQIAEFFVNDEAKFQNVVSYPDLDGKPQTQWPSVVSYLNIDQPFDWADKLYEVTIPGPLPDSAPITRSLLPCVLYRMMVDPDGNPISGDLVQCSPLIGNDSTMAITVIEPPLANPGIYLRDPFLLFGEPVPESTGLRIPLFIKDNQPVIRKEAYRYYLALTDARGETAAILDLGLITIP